MPVTIDPTFLDPPPDPNADVSPDPNAGGFAGDLSSDNRDVTTDPGFSADPTANAAVSGLDDSTGTRTTAGLPGSTADGALLSQFPDAGFAQGTTVPGDVAEPSLAAAAPPTAAPSAAAGLPGSGGVPPSDAHFITRLGDQGARTSAGAGLPGNPAAATGGTPGSFQQEFEKQFGYYDPRFNSQANMEQNLLRGDAVIRPQAEYMAQFDPNLRAELNTINGLPDFYNSQNAASWDAAHNQELTQRVASGDLSLAAAHGQGVAVPTHPVDNAHALVTQGMQDSLVKTLTAMGVDPASFHQTFDPYGNATLNFTSASGKPQSIQATLVGYATALDQLKQNVAAAAAPHVAPPGGGGGGYAPRAAAPRYAPTHASGGYAPPTAAAPPVMPSGFDVQNDIGSSAGYDTLAAQRLAAFDTMGPGGTRPNVPRSVASAVAYSPALTPGGNSPYDQP